MKIGVYTYLLTRPVFGFTKELGAVGSESVSTLFSIGLTQDNAISFLGEGDGLTSVPSLWKSYFSSSLDAVCLVYQNLMRERCTDLG